MQPLRILAKPGLHLADGQYQRHHTTALIINNKPFFYQSNIKNEHFLHRSQSCNYKVHLSTHISSHLIEPTIAIHSDI